VAGWIGEACAYGGVRVETPIEHGHPLGPTCSPAPTAHQPRQRPFSSSATTPRALHRIRQPCLRSCGAHRRECRTWRPASRRASSKRAMTLFGVCAMQAPSHQHRLRPRSRRNLRSELPSVASRRL